MKIFLDANILVSVLNKEYPIFTYTSRILSLAGSTRYKVFTSPICLAIAFYFAEKKTNTRKAKEKIAILCQHIQIANTDGNTVLQSLENPAVNDFEDGLEYYAAIQSDCTCIITEDISDFYFSTIEVVTSETFFNKYLLPKQ